MREIKTPKTVLVVDDDPSICEMVEYRFTVYNKKIDALYEFKVDRALSTEECIDKIRSNFYSVDVIVLDVVMIKGVLEDRSGIDSALAIAVNEQMGWEAPLRIIFTGHPSYGDCVEAVRHGAWDYIVKEDLGDKGMTEILVDSALAGLKQIDLRNEQEQQIAADWLPKNYYKLQTQYGGKIIALWNHPEVQIIASGHDAFELEDCLRDWRKQHARWEQPWIVRIPKLKNEEDE